MSSAENVSQKLGLFFFFFFFFFPPKKQSVFPPCKIFCKTPIIKQIKAIWFYAGGGGGGGGVGYPGGSPALPASGNPCWRSGTTRDAFGEDCWGVGVGWEDSREALGDLAKVALISVRGLECKWRGIVVETSGDKAGR